MSKFPDSVLTTTKKGEVEARMLIDRGKFVRYRYVDAETGEDKGGGKVKLVLSPENGGMEEFFVIPTKGGRSLLLKAEVKGEKMLWDGEKAVGL